MSTPRTVAVGALAAAAVAITLAAPAAAQPEPTADAPQVIAHRGSGGTSPENTVASFRDGRTSRAEFFEIDVQLSADGVPFLFHDADGGRTTDVAEVFPDRAEDPITSFTWDELSQLDAGSYFGVQYTGERIPHLNDAAAQARGNIGVNVEIKSPESSPGVEQVLAEAIATERHWQRLLESDRLVVSSFDEESLRTFHELAPEVPLLQVGEVPDDATLASWAEFATTVVTNYRTLDPADVARVHDAGLALSVYTANAPEAWAQLTDLGVDSIITDFPAALVRFQRGAAPVPAANGIEVADVVADVPGPDLTPEVGEHVVLTNTSDRAIDVSGYVLQDAVIHRLVVGEGYVIPPGGELRVYTGPGTNTDTAYYNDYGANVLNNNGDSIAVMRPMPSLVLLDLYAY